MRKNISLISLIFILVATNYSSASKLAADDRYFTYDPSHYWGNEHEDWTTCKDGTQQSPINIDNSNIIQSNETLSMDASSGHAIMQSNGHAVTISWSNGGGSTVFNHTTYFIRENHWHIPSEHTFNHKSYPLELHMVHTTYDQSQTLVVGLLYDFSTSSDSFLDELEDGLTQLIDNPSTSKQYGYLTHPIIPNGNSFYNYMGSLTTPPCTQGLTWIVAQTVGNVKPSQVDLLSRIVNYTSNSRPVQPINSRSVHLHQPDLIRQVTDNIASY